jgi:tetratricopeptide (TPR) repeat protein
MLALDLTSEERGAAERRIGELLAARGRTEAAIGHLQSAAAALPKDAATQIALAGLLGREGRFTEAAAAFDRAVALAPDDRGAHFGRATAYILAGLHSDARRGLEASLASHADDVALRGALARLLAAAPDAAVRVGARALELADAVAREEPSFEHGATLAMALAETGRFAEAAEVQRRLVAEAERTGETRLAARFKIWLASYERGEPVREPWRE